MNPSPRLLAFFLFLLLAPLASAAPPLPNDGQPHRFSAANAQFTLDDQPLQIIAGEMHPSRIPYQFWEDRIKKARAMGLNTVSVYVFWNQLEPKENQFNFKDGNDIHRFIQLCQDNGLWVILRPGPYVCAETEFGGFPAWLLKHHGMQLRTDDPGFMTYCRRYLQTLHDQLADQLITHGGPILMVQFENELGKIDPYLTDLKQTFIDVGFDTQLFTCDHSGPVWNKLDGLPNVLRATNGLPNDTKLKLAQAVTGNFPVYGSEVYTAWFSLWGGPVAHMTVEKQLANTQWLLDRHLSFCYYVFDGGTNFGYSNGAKGWQPVQTTYDYDAPVDELGRVTPKFHALRDLFIKTLHIDPPPIPADPKVIELPATTLIPSADLLSSFSPYRPVHSEDVQSMEDLNQAYGFILYRHRCPDGIHGQLDLSKALDYSIVMIDGQVVGHAFRGYGVKSLQVSLDNHASCDLDIIVYNLGRNSVGIDQKISRKGLTENPTLDGQPLRGWDIYRDNLIDIVTLPVAHPSAETNTPMLYTATLNIPTPGETYLDLRNFHFGVAWLNGHNLGRFWDAGADRCLYAPSVWQKAGDNHLAILELGDPPSSPTITGATHFIEEPAKPFPAAATTKP